MAASPAVRGASGLEIWSWVVADPTLTPEPPPTTDGQPAPPPKLRVVDSRLDPGAALAPYQDRPVPMAEDLRQRWRACGLRIIAVPVKDLESVADRMRLMGQVQRQWLGHLTSWTDIAHGPSLEERRTVMIDDGPMSLPAGRPRLLARCYPTPAVGGAGEPIAALRLELVIHQATRVDEAGRWRTAAGIAPPDTGLRFDRLAAGMTVTREEAYFIVADSPQAEWSATLGAPSAPSEGSGQSGPVVDVPPTLGEFMFSVPAGRGRPRQRAVLVLVPRVPDRFDLLP